jgi:hypothetical protein
VSHRHAQTYTNAPLIHIRSLSIGISGADASAARLDPFGVLGDGVAAEKEAKSANPTRVVGKLGVPFAHFK